MIGQSILCLMIISLALPLSDAKPPTAAKYGIGFELTLDYGAASVYFPNKTTVDIAKIEGSPAYKQMMRAAYNNVSSPGIAYPSEDTTTVVSQSIRDYLPPWLGGKESLDPLTLILKALKSATEAYLEARTSTVTMAVQYPATRVFDEKLCSTLRSLSLRGFPRLSTRCSWLTGMRVGAFPYKVGPGQCSHYPLDPSHLYLAVEYTRSSLTALVGTETCGVWDAERVLHKTDVDLVNLENALIDLIKLPIELPGNEILASFDNLLLLGESADDPMLHDLLRRILPDKLVATATQALKGAIDPVFAGANSAAELDYYLQTAAPAKELWEL